MHSPFVQDKHFKTGEVPGAHIAQRCGIKVCGRRESSRTQAFRESEQGGSPNQDDRRASSLACGPLASVTVFERGSPSMWIGSNVSLRCVAGACGPGRLRSSLTSGWRSRTASRSRVSDSSEAIISSTDITSGHPPLTYCRHAQWSLNYGQGSGCTTTVALALKRTLALTWF